MRKQLTDYLAMHYPYKVVAELDGAYFIEFPDLPGCMTQALRAEDIGPMAEEIRTLWLETEYERGAEIPLPSAPVEYSGKFVLRLPKSLHRALADSAALDGVSLNQYVVMLLERGDTLAAVQRHVERLAEHTRRTGLVSTSAG